MYMIKKSNNGIHSCPKLPPEFHGLLGNLTAPCGIGEIVLLNPTNHQYRCNCPMESHCPRWDGEMAQTNRTE